MEAPPKQGGGEAKGSGRLDALCNTIQPWLFPALEDELAELGEKHRRCVAVRQAWANGTRMGHVAVTDHNPRRGEKREFAPAEAVRCLKRGFAERVFSRLQNNHGANRARVRGFQQGGMAARLSFGLLAIAAEQLLKLLG